jgi:hypothetical protein
MDRRLIDRKQYIALHYPRLGPSAACEHAADDQTTVGVEFERCCGSRRNGNEYDAEA